MAKVFFMKQGTLLVGELDLKTLYLQQHTKVGTIKEVYGML